MPKIFSGLKPISGGNSGNGTELTEQQIININNVPNKADKSYVDTELQKKSDINHTHEMFEIEGLNDELNDRYTKAETMSKEEIENLITAIAMGVTWRPPVDTVADLPMTSNREGDARIVKDEDAIYIWNDTSSQWVEIGSSSIVNLASSSQDGLMSKEDKAKLDAIILDELVTLTDMKQNFIEKDKLQDHLIAGENVTLDYDISSQTITIDLSSNAINLKSLPTFSKQ